TTKFNSPSTFFENESSKNTDYTVISFYSLIGMACLYSASFSMFAINRLEANSGAKGARTSVSSAPKYKMILSSLLATFIIQFISLLVLLAYLIFILKINFGNNLNLILLVCFVGTIVSSMLGIFVSTLFKGNVEKKTGIIIGYTMVCSFLAGMMFIDMKYIVADKFPILANINPVNLITDSLYAIYYYSEPSRVFINVFFLLMFAFVLFLLSINSLRRKRYDSI
ncbi:MAG: ABC transporter permease, partial [Bacilli bacterium]